MIADLMRVKLYDGYSLAQANEVRRILTEHQIAYTTRMSQSFSSLSGKAPLLQIDEDRNHAFRSRIYVAKKDGKRARYLAGRLAFRKQKSTKQK